MTEIYEDEGSNDGGAPRCKLRGIRINKSSSNLLESV